VANFIAIDLQLYKVLKIVRVSFFWGHIVHICYGTLRRFCVVCSQRNAQVAATAEWWMRWHCGKAASTATHQQFQASNNRSYDKIMTSITVKN